MSASTDRPQPFDSLTVICRAPVEITTVRLTNMQVRRSPNDVVRRIIAVQDAQRDAARHHRLNTAARI